MGAGALVGGVGDVDMLGGCEDVAEDLLERVGFEGGCAAGGVVGETNDVGAGIGDPSDHQADLRGCIVVEGFTLLAGGHGVVQGGEGIGAGGAIAGGGLRVVALERAAVDDGGGCAEADAARVIGYQVECAAGGAEGDSGVAGAEEGDGGEVVPGSAAMGSGAAEAGADALLLARFLANPDND